MTQIPANIAVVDDEMLIRYALQTKLSKAGYNVISLEKAEDLLYLIKNGENIDLIITDVKLRKMDGIELLRRVQGLDDPIPVLILTGHCNVEDAISALRYGASNFIRKPFDINDVISSVRTILRDKHEKKLVEGFAKYVRYEKFIYKIPADPSLINPICAILTRDLTPSGLFNRTTTENITLALREAINNSMFHGNLEIPSVVREKGGIKRFNDEIEKRRFKNKYKNRMVVISSELTKDYVEYTITDEGNGFDHRSLPDVRDPENFLMNSGRGLLIVKIHMDEVTWNEKGNEIRLRKNKAERNNEIQREMLDVYN
jgi:DNA-binding response OmpR family regulator